MNEQDPPVATPEPASSVRRKVWEAGRAAGLALPEDFNAFDRRVATDGDVRRKVWEAGRAAGLALPEDFNAFDRRVAEASSTEQPSFQQPLRPMSTPMNGAAGGASSGGPGGSPGAPFAGGPASAPGGAQGAPPVGAPKPAAFDAAGDAIVSLKDFERRAMDPRGPSIKNADGSFSTHRMASAEVDGRQIAYPTIVPMNGRLVQLDDDAAIDHALRTGEFREFNTERDAQAYAEGGYKRGTPLDRPLVRLPDMPPALAALPDGPINLSEGEAKTRAAITKKDDRIRERIQYENDVLIPQRQERAAAVTDNSFIPEDRRRYTYLNNAAPPPPAPGMPLAASQPDQRAMKAEEDYWKFANATGERSTQFSREERTQRIREGAWKPEQQAAYELDVLQHQADVLGGRAMRVNKLLTEGVGRDVLNAEIEDINAGKQYVQERMAELAQRDTRTFADKWRQAKQIITDATGSKTASQARQFLQGNAQMLTSAAGGALKLLDPSDGYTLADRFADAMEDVYANYGADIRSKAKGGAIQRDAQGNRRFSGEGFLGSLSQGAGSMLAIIGTGGAASTAGRAMGIAGSTGGTGVLAASYLQGYNDFIDSAERDGVKREDVDGIGMAYGLLYAAAERFINPQLLRAEMPAASKRFMDTIRAGKPVKEATKNFIEGGTKEFAEEMTQGVSEAAANYAANSLTGSKLDDDITADEAANTFLASFLLGGIADVGMNPNLGKSAAKKEALSWAVNNPQAAAEAINTHVPEDQRKGFYDKLAEVSKLYQGNDLNRFGVDNAADMADLIARKQRLQAAIKEAPMDEALKGAIGDRREAEVTAIDQRLATLANNDQKPPSNAGQGGAGGSSGDAVTSPAPGTAKVAPLSPEDDALLEDDENDTGSPSTNEPATKPPAVQGIQGEDQGGAPTAPPDTGAPPGVPPAPEPEATEPVTEEEDTERDRIMDDALMGGKAAEQRQAGKRIIAGQEYQRQEPKDAPTGKSGKVQFSDGIDADFEYVLMEAGDIQPSHNNGRRNPLHFIPEAQPKARTDKESKLAAQRIAEAPDLGKVSASPNAYSGAPIVNERGEVVQGNNRASGLKEHYSQGGEQYKQDLAERAAEFGLTPEQVQGMKAPVLVRRITVPDAKSIELGNYDSKDIETGGKRGIDPVAVSARIPSAAKGRIVDVVFADPNATMKASVRDNFGAVVRLLEPYLNPAQRSSLYRPGTSEPSAKGMDELEGLVKHFMFDGGPVELAEIFESGLPSMAQRGVEGAMPAIFSSPEAIPMVREVQNAIMAAAQFRASGVDSFDAWSVQSDAFGPSPKEDYTPTEIAMAKVLAEAKTAKGVKEKLVEYAGLTSGKDATMFDEATEGVPRQQAAEQVFGIKPKSDEQRADTEGVQEAPGGVAEKAPAAPKAEQSKGKVEKAAAQDGPMQQKLRSQERDLVVQHNLSAANLVHADKMGGLAVPSLAITTKDNTTDSFGEITLIGDEEMADPKGPNKTKVFGADIYSPRYPQASYFVDGKKLRALEERVEPYRKKYGERSLGNKDEFITDGRSRLEKNAGVMAMFLESAGVDVAPVMENGNVNQWQTQSNLRNAVEARQEQFQEFVDGLWEGLDPTEKLFKGFTYAGNRRYEAHTLDNVVRELKKELRAGEGFNYGAGTVRAKFTPQFRSVAAIRKEKGRIMSKEQFEKIKEEASNELVELANALGEYYKHEAGFSFLDTVSNVIMDASRGNLDGALREYRFENVPAELKQRVRDYMDKLRNMPTEYFEAKVTRAVGLGEFKAAVVPSDTSKKAREVLEKNGIPVFEYDKSKKGDRQRAVQQAASAGDLMFQRPRPEDGKGPPPKTGKPRTDRVLKALRALLPDLSIIIPKTQEEYALITEGIKEGLSSGWGVYDPASRRIIVNPASPDLKQTLFHEAAHPVIAALMHNDRARFAKFYNEVVAEAGGKYARYGKQYGDQPLSTQQQEALVEYLADVAAGKIDISKGSLLERIADFLRGIMEALGFKADTIDLSRPDNVRSFARKLSNALNEGITITGLTPSTDPTVMWAKEMGISVEEAQRQYDAVVAQYTNKDGTKKEGWMKAPNGQATKLNERQWVQTRTPAFLNWFGDFLNDPKNASKVVDANGDPLVVYHGTKGDIEEFDVNRLTKNTSAKSAALGFFFTDFTYTADKFAGYSEVGGSVVPVYLKMDKPTIDTSSDFREKRDSEGFKTGTKIVDRYGVPIVEKDAYEKLRETVLSYGMEYGAFREKSISLGYDGVILRGTKMDGMGDISTHYVVFAPNQIKSATANTGQFGPAGNIMLQNDADRLVDGWYSRLNDAVNSKGRTQPASEWKNWVAARAKEGAFSLEEARWTGLNDWLDSKGKEKVTPEEVRKFLDENRVKVEVVTLDSEAAATDGSADPAKFESYQLPGGTNYREVLVTLPVAPKKPREVDTSNWSIERFQDSPSKGKVTATVTDPVAGTMIDSIIATDLSDEQVIEKVRAKQVEREARYAKAQTGFRSSHFAEPNILVHLRLNDRTVDVPLTDKEKSDMRERERMIAERDKLAPAIRAAAAKVKAIEDAGRKKRHEEGVAKLKSGEFNSVAEMRDWMDRFSAAEGTPELAEWQRLQQEWFDYNDRMPREVKPRKEKVLFIEELQSDFGQAGKKKGFAENDPFAAEYASLVKKNDALRTKARELQGDLKTEGEVAAKYPEEYAAIRKEADPIRQRLLEIEQAQARRSDAPPSAPFVTSTEGWVELGMKQAIRMAVEGGYDRIAWSTGEQQFGRWGSQAFAWSKGKTGWRVVAKEQVGGDAFEGMEEALAQEAKESDTIITSKEELRGVVEDVMGRERSDYSPENWRTHINKMVDGMWERMQSEDSGTTMPRREGMKGFYDKILPIMAGKVGKKLGGDGKVQPVTLGTPKDAATEVGTQQGMAITPAMRQRVSAGVPMMQQPRKGDPDPAKVSAFAATLNARGLTPQQARAHMEARGFKSRTIDAVIAAMTGAPQGSLFNQPPGGGSNTGRMGGAAGGSGTTPPSPPPPPGAPGTPGGRPVMTPAQVQAILDRQRADARGRQRGWRRRIWEAWVKAFEHRRGVADRMLKENSLDPAGAARAITLKNLAAGASNVAKDAFRKYHDAVHKGLSQQEKERLDDLIQLRRTVAVDERRDAQLRERVDNPGGMAAEDARRALDDMRRSDPTLFAKLDARADSYFAAMSDLLRQSYDAGLITKEVYDDLKDDEYSPRKFIHHMLDAETRMSVGGMDITGNGIKNLTTGSEESLYNNSEWLLAAHALSTYKRIYNNEANKALHAHIATLGTHHDNPGVGYVLREGETSRPGYTRIGSFVDGKEQAVAVMNEIAVPWTTNDPVIRRDAANAIRIVTGGAFKRLAITGANPAFALSNVPRDIAHALLFTDTYSNALPVALAQIGADIKAVSADVWGRKGRYAEYINEGGGMDLLTHQGRPLTGASVSMEKGIGERVLHVAGYINETSELLVRLAIREREIRKAVAAYERANGAAPGREALADIKRMATAKAREQMDFSQGGEWSKAIDTFIPYFNATLQGTRVMARSMRNDPTRFAVKLAQLGALSVALVLYNMDFDEWDEVPDHEKENNFIIFLPFMRTGRNGQKQRMYLKIPKSQDQRAFAGGFEGMTEWANGGKFPTKRSIHTLLEAAPIKPDFILDIPLADAMYAYATGFDRFHGDFISHRMRPVEPWKEYRPGKTEQFYRDMGLLTSRKDEEGDRVGGISPERLKLAVGKYTGLTEGNVFHEYMNKGYAAAAGAMDKEGSDEMNKRMGEHVEELTAPFTRRMVGWSDPEKTRENPLERYSRKEATRRELLNDEVKEGLARYREAKTDAERSKADAAMKKAVAAMPAADQKRAADRYATGRKQTGVDYVLIDILHEPVAAVRARAFLDLWLPKDENGRKRMQEQAEKIGLTTKTFMDEFARAYAKDVEVEKEKAEAE